MFDTDLPVDAGQAAALVAASRHAVVEHETRLVLLAALWADLHSVVATPGRPGGERLRPYGGPGTPEVSEFAAAELGLLQDTTTTAAAYHRADALDLRHRHPRLWRLLSSGGPSGQTRVDNLGPLNRRSHRIRPTAAGACDNPAPVSICGGHRKDGSAWSPTKAPSRSAAATMPRRSGPPLAPSPDLIRADPPRTTTFRWPDPTQLKTCAAGAALGAAHRDRGSPGRAARPTLA